MARLHLSSPSACRPAYRAAQDDSWAEARRSVLENAGGICAYCDVSGASLDLYFIDNDPRNLDPDNIRAACPLCRSGQSLRRPQVDLEFLPVWLPEIDQVAINRIAGTLHRRLILAGESPVIDHRQRPMLDDRTTRDLVSAYLGFANRRARLGILLGGYAPTARDLVTLFYSCDPVRGLCPEHLAPGLRLLPLGRYFYGDVDRYAAVLGLGNPSGSAVDARPAEPAQPQGLQPGPHALVQPPDPRSSQP